MYEQLSHPKCYYYRVKWKREEALSEALQSEFVDLPVDYSTYEHLSRLYVGGATASLPLVIGNRLVAHAIGAVVSTYYCA